MNRLILEYNIYKKINGYKDFNTWQLLNLKLVKDIKEYIKHQVYVNSALLLACKKNVKNKACKSMKR